MHAGENDSGLALAGGTESMSQAPLSVYGQNARFGHRLGTDMSLQDTLWAALTDSFAKMPMGVTAETLGAKYGITREACDRFALRSQERWAAAHKAGALAATLAPVALAGKKGPESFAADEHPRAGATYEALAKLAPVFKKDGGLVSAGNASGICDGAAALVLATEAAAKAHGLAPLARVVGWATAGVDPKIMGLGPAPAIRALLKKTGVALKDVGMLEVNEAFAAQVLAVAADLGVDAERFNEHGGAIALGHPLGASGARIRAWEEGARARGRKCARVRVVNPMPFPTRSPAVGLLAHRLASTPSARYAIGSACIGGGQGTAVLLERV